MNKLVSIIVPVFNVEEYISRCVMSLANQTYNNIEIILVDDGSTDSSGKKCDRLASDDDRIIVIHQGNEGVSEARNTGLHRSTGEYICFVDADDYVASTFVEYLFCLSTKYNADISQCGFCMMSDEPNPFNSGSMETVYADGEIRKNIFNGINTMNCVLNMYRRDLILKCPFPKGMKYGEDSIVVLRSILAATRLVVGDARLYYYYDRNDSAMNQFLAGNIDKDIIGCKYVRAKWLHGIGEYDIEKKAWNDYTLSALFYSCDISPIHGCFDEELRNAKKDSLIWNQLPNETQKAINRYLMFPWLYRKLRHAKKMIRDSL